MSSSAPNQHPDEALGYASQVQTLRKRVDQLAEENEELKRDKRSFRDASDQSRRDLVKAQEAMEELKKKHGEAIDVFETRTRIRDEGIVALKARVEELEALVAAKPSAKRKNSDEDVPASSKKRRTAVQPVDGPLAVAVATQDAPGAVPAPIPTLPTQSTATSTLAEGSGASPTEPTVTVRDTPQASSSTAEGSHARPLLDAFPLRARAAPVPIPVPRRKPRVSALVQGGSIAAGKKSAVAHAPHSSPSEDTVVRSRRRTRSNLREPSAPTPFEPILHEFWPANPAPRQSPPPRDGIQIYPNPFSIVRSGHYKRYC